MTFYSNVKMDKKKDKKLLTTCDECNSEYYSKTSKMATLCPECSHIIYGYDNCDHKFENGRCLKCFWDGSRSDYVKGLLEK